MRKKIMTLIVMMVLMMPVTAYAKTGNISVELEKTENNLPVDNVKLGFKYIATLEDGTFQSTESGASIDLNTIKSSEDLKNAIKELDKINDNTADYTIITDQTGKGNISNLPVGAYYMFCLDKARYEIVQSTIVMIPQQVDGNMKYDITITPKHVPPTGKITTKLPKGPNNFQTGISDSIMLYGTAAIGFGILGLICILSSHKQHRK